MKTLVHPHRKENFKMVRLCLLYVHSLNFNLENLLINKINNYQSQKVPHVFLRAPSYLFHFQIFIADQTRPCCLFLLVKFLMRKRNESKYERACWCLCCRNMKTNDDLADRNFSYQKRTLNTLCVPKFKWGLQQYLRLQIGLTK